MATRTETYVDTSAFVAFADRSDTHHPLFARLFSDPPGLVTTSLVVAEGQDWFLKRFDTARALQFLAMIEALEPLQVLEIGPSEVRGGAEMLRKFRDQRLTLTQAVGLHVMRTLKTRCCWSTDRHLGLTGVPLAIGRGSLGKPRARRGSGVRSRRSR
jgi:predicted nucleic acid-binding protein